MMTDLEIHYARQDFAELREIIKGKTMPDLITEIKADEKHVIDICNTLDDDAHHTDDPNDVRMLDVNFNSLNPTISVDDNGFCTLDIDNPTVDVYSWHDKECDDMYIGYLTYEEITAK